MKYYTTNQLFKLGYLPEELDGYFKNKCSVCESFIINSENLKQRFCSNYNCKGYIKNRANILLKTLNVKGVAGETAWKLMVQKNMKTYFELIPLYYEKKPKMYLYQVAALCFIPSYQNKWEDILDGFVSFSQFLSSNKCSSEVRKYSSILLEAEKYFDILPPLTGKKIEIMITGHIGGTQNKKQFVARCNNILKGYYQIKLNGLRKTGMHYLIVGNDPGNDKLEAARNSPYTKIVTPQEFINELIRFISEHEAFRDNLDTV